MKVTLIGEMNSYDQKVRVTYYRQENGNYFALRTDRAKQRQGQPDFLSEHRDMDQSELMAMITSMIPTPE
jgi:hypothetical protein